MPAPSSKYYREAGSSDGFHAEVVSPCDELNLVRIVLIVKLMRPTCEATVMKSVPYLRLCLFLPRYGAFRENRIPLAFTSAHRGTRLCRDDFDGSVAVVTLNAVIDGKKYELGAEAAKPDYWRPGTIRRSSLRSSTFRHMSLVKNTSFSFLTGESKNFTSLGKSE
jgi:hypothetical protein